MQVIPAIDLMNGKVVRLTRGDPEQAKFYDHLGTPVEMALEVEERRRRTIAHNRFGRGFRQARQPKGGCEIAETTGLPIQVGGGIRSVEAVEKLLNAGIQYVILGSLAFQRSERDSADSEKIRCRPRHSCFGQQRRQGDG